jgi:hypothetical protein
MYGFGKSKRIVLYDTLLKQCNKDQVRKSARFKHHDPEPDILPVAHVCG